jgi:hypothetical protein
MVRLAGSAAEIERGVAQPFQTVGSDDWGGDDWGGDDWGGDDWVIG